MSGGNGNREDLSPGIGNVRNDCGKTYTAPLNSPKAAVLAPLGPGSVLAVEVVNPATNPVLVVKNAAGDIAGSLTFLGFVQVVNCILQQGVDYHATILSVSGGVYTVEVAPK